MTIVYIFLGSFCFVVIFYILSRLFWKAGFDQLDHSLLKHLPKFKNNDNKTQE